MISIALINSKGKARGGSNRLDTTASMKTTPVPWYAVVGESTLEGYPKFWEEHIDLDVLMTAAQNAVERRPRGKSKANTAQV